MNRDQRDQTNKESPAWLRDKFKSMGLESDPCPKCGKPLNDAPGGGVKCSGKDCKYWFCY